MTHKIKALAAIVGVIVGAALVAFVSIEFWWLCYYSGLPM